MPVMNCVVPGTAPQETRAPSQPRLLHEYGRLEQRVTARTTTPGHGVALMRPRVYAVPASAMPMRVDTKSGLEQMGHVNVLPILIVYRCASGATEHIARRAHTCTVSPKSRSSGSELLRNNRSATKRGQ